MNKRHQVFQPLLSGLFLQNHLPSTSQTFTTDTSCNRIVFIKFINHLLATDAVLLNLKKQQQQQQQQQHKPQNNKKTHAVSHVCLVHFVFSIFSQHSINEH